jgi:hypothetical protein
MPPYNPLDDRSLAWAIARVSSCEPSTATWSAPALVELRIEETLRGSLPPVLRAIFDAPREMQQARFYVARGLGPNPTPEASAAAAAQFAALDATPVELPRVGAKIIVWIGEHVARQEPEPSPPLPGPLMMGTQLDLPPEGAWRIPTLRLFEPTSLPIRSRWIEHTDAAERAVRQRLEAQR